MFGPGYVTAVPYSGTWTFDQANGTLRSPSFDSAGFAPWASYQLLAPGSMPQSVMVGGYDSMFSSFLPGEHQLALVCPAPVVVTPSGSNILIDALDDVAGDGVSGTSTLFSGNVGQIVIALIAVSLAGVILGAFWYLKRRAENGSD